MRWDYLVQTSRQLWPRSDAVIETESKFVKQHFKDAYREVRKCLLNLSLGFC